jgi:hypothetical protein
MSIAVIEALQRHADVCDELTRLSVCARCVVRLVCGDVAQHEHSNVRAQCLHIFNAHSTCPKDDIVHHFIMMQLGFFFFQFL